jgi:hypothetical protein
MSRNLPSIELSGAKIALDVSSPRHSFPAQVYLHPEKQNGGRSGFSGSPAVSG